MVFKNVKVAENVTWPLQAKQIYEHLYTLCAAGRLA